MAKETTNKNDELITFPENETIELQIYDTVFEVTIDKDRIEEYCNAADLVTDRFNAYTEAYKDSKTEHEIALMTMLDLALRATSENRQRT